MLFQTSIVFFVLISSAVLPAGRPDAPATTLFHLGIRLRVDPSITSRRTIDSLKGEAEALWEPYGVRLEWIDGATEPGGSDLALDASLEREPETARTEWSGVLGYVGIRPDAPHAEPIRLSFDATERVLANRTTGRMPNYGYVLDRELGRALGRVLAHEIGHVLLSAPYHAEAGLMRPSFPAGELMDVDRAPFRLTSLGIARLRARLPALSGSPR